MAHVVIVGSSPDSLANFRGALIRRLVADGHTVTAMSAPAAPEQERELHQWGAAYRSFPIQRNGLNPWSDARAFFTLARAIRDLSPDVVLAYTIKPVIWCGLALAGRPSIRYVALITGLGFALRGESALRRALTGFVSALYRVALKRADRAIFQNRDNRDSFVRGRLVHDSQCAVVEGSGVDMSYFGVSEMPASEPAFLLIARLLVDKGLRTYAASAKIVKRKYPKARFLLLGPSDPSPDAVPIEEVREWHREGVLEYLGAVGDVRPHIAASHVCVLPSQHEGLPRTLIEAMSMGRPILTTDVPGCRETVVSGLNGFLVPAADADALAERMIWFIEHRDSWEMMARASRELAARRFEISKVNAGMLKEMGLLTPVSKS